MHRSFGVIYNEAIEFILALLYPERCVVCDEVIGIKCGGVCKRCENQLVKIENRCFKCGKEVFDEKLEYCNDCENVVHNFYKGFPLYVYNEAAKKSIYRFKYANRQRYAKYYGKQMAKELGNQIKAQNPDILIPVPIHKKRLRKRGYNQALLLAEELGKELGIRVVPDCVIRVKNTRPLKIFGREERQNNLKKAFKIGQYDVKLSSIVIVDDIYTTGSTVDEISDVLLSAGAKSVCYVSLASGSNI